MRVLPAIASALALLSCAQAAPLEERGRPHHDLSYQLTHDVKIKNLLKHTDALQKIADKNNGTRVFSSSGHNATIDYIYNLGKKNGYKTWKQHGVFSYSETVAQTVTITDPKVDTPEIKIKLMQYTSSTPEEGVEGELVATGNLGCTAADYGDVTGKIALVQRGTCPFDDKATSATAAGAIAVLVYNNEDGDVSGTLSGPLPDTVPIAGMSKAIGEELIALAAKSTVTLNAKIIEFIEDRTSANVCAETRGGDKTNVVMLGAHTDSVVDGPGINDNGSGTAALLEVSRLFRKVKPNNAVRFCWWTAEEFGLLGAEHYVSQLDEDEIADIALYLNFDMIASPNYINGIYDGDGSEFSTAGPEGSGAIESLLQKYFESQGAKHEASEFDGRSDYGPFIDVGIPSGGTFTGAEELKTEEQAKKYGGKAGVALDECYHAKCDTSKNLNNEAFELHAKAIAHAVATYSYSTESVNGVAPPKKGHGPGKGHGHGKGHGKGRGGHLSAKTHGKGHQRVGCNGTPVHTH